jgi:hypothetical protein
MGKSPQNVCRFLAMIVHNILNLWQDDSPMIIWLFSNTSLTANQEVAIFRGFLTKLKNKPHDGFDIDMGPILGA